MDIRVANEAVASHPLFQRCREDPLLRVSHLLLHWFLKNLLITLDIHLISSVTSHMFAKIKHTLGANMPKQASQQLECVDKEQLKTR